ncbi:MAG: TonB-dependent receptor plug domain-containing protein [Parcubacteria group bacterium]
MRHFGRLARARLLAGVSAAVILAGAAAAHAEDRTAINIAPQPLASALYQFGGQTGLQVMFAPSLAERKSTVGVNGETDVRLAMAHLLEGTGLTFRREGDIFVIMDANDPQSAGAAGDGADAGTVAALVVTAQKREENIQDVPIAISAFTEKSLQEQKIEGGFDLLKAIPNVSFSKNNFSGYNFSIRGIGTKAISVTTDPGVAVEFNSTPLIRNRLFEQEYFDVERVEVLRGPQGTLHGRNATAGVINVISAKPVMNEFNGWLKGEIGNYNTKRLSAMVNVPLVNDKVAIRFAGAATMRDGFTINLFDNTHDDGRNLWSARMTVGFNPTENIRTNLIWERFEEDDDRSRTSKQLCTPDPGPEKVGNRTITLGAGASLAVQRGIYSQGCLPGSLYDDAAYGAPNGFAIPFIAALAQTLTGTLGFDSRYTTSPFSVVYLTALKYAVDPYGGVTQSHDLRAIYSRLHPTYQAKTDVLEWNTDIRLGDHLSVTVQTGYSKDRIYSTQDYNRYTTVPSFNDTTYAITWTLAPNGDQVFVTSGFHDLVPGGVFCDPQLGCSDTIVGEDLSRARSEQFTQEIRVASDFQGPLNFVLGGNFLRYRTVEDYYVFNNGITLAGVVGLNGGPAGAGFYNPSAPDRFTTNPDCSIAPAERPGPLCVPIENNPIANIQDVGHNYFLSKNPYVLTSKSVFGEIYWDVSGRLKLTTGVRYTDDRKRFTSIPSQTLLTPRDYVGLQQQSDWYRAYFLSLPFTGSGFGYPVEGVSSREWKEVTGRLGVEWRPELQFADQTLVYAFYARGYKGGGFNPPRPGFNYEEAAFEGNVYAFAAPPEFDPEFVNSFEVGSKNTLLGGGAVLNATAFFYDYKGYQISKIVDRSAYNENFDARVWGVELEGVFSPTRNLRLNASLGYLDTALDDDSKSIDVMNRTAGHTDWILVKPAVTLPSNCIVPVYIAELAGAAWGNELTSSYACPGGGPLGGNLTGKPPFYASLPGGITYDPADHPEANYGAGFYSDVSGHELPNSPHFTVTLGAQYSFELLENWRGTIRADGYWQSQSWARVYELPIDKLHGWYNANLSVWVERPDDGLKIEFYVKNLLDETPITDAFINSDDSALTTNVFTLDPRLIGLSIRKEF